MADEIYRKPLGKYEQGRLLSAIFYKKRPKAFFCENFVKREEVFDELPDYSAQTLDKNEKMSYNRHSKFYSWL